MKTKNFLRTIGSLIMIISISVLSSCSKPADETMIKENKDLESESASLSEEDFSESDEDLSTVDYKEFYDQLSPHGEWIQVRYSEIGLNPNTAQSQNDSSDDYLTSFSSVFGIKDANAGTDVNESMVFVWKPSIDLGVSVTGNDPVFTPYTNGQWVNTDAGWYFKAPTPAEETVSHYGRWVNSPTAGWLWVPGRVWAPAWVDWKQNEDYVSWAPLPPSVYLNNNVINKPVINYKEYVIVERKNFLEPSIYKYKTLYYEDGSTILVKEMKGTEGIVVINNIINNVGPDLKTIQYVYNRNIELIKLHRVKKQKEVIYSNGEYYVYTPGFRKFKNKGKRLKINEPESYKEYDEWYVKNSDGKDIKHAEENEDNDKGYKKDKENKSEKYNGKNDDGNKGKKGNKNNGNNSDMNNKKNNDDKHNGNDNGNKSNDNGNKNNDKDKGNKSNGKNDGKGKK